MKKSKYYARARFSPEVLRAAAGRLWLGLDESTPLAEGTLRVDLDDATWNHDSEDEFFADYRLSSGTAFYWRGREKRALNVSVSEDGTQVEVSGPNRELIQATFEIFERSLSESLLPNLPALKPTVFIGHGRSEVWRDLKDHLQDKHGYRVETYEAGARAGHAIRHILGEMLETSSFAVLALTGEDETAVGDLRARQNVIHEVGLFQGRLGFARAILLVEDGVELFSNIDGIQQIRFTKGHFAETFGEVLATLRREFGNPAAARERRERSND